MLVNQNEILEAYAGLEGRDLIHAFARDFRGRIALLSSFGAESSVLLHMMSEVDREIPVIFLDTQKLFRETIAYRDRLVRESGGSAALLGLPLASVLLRWFTTTATFTRLMVPTALRSISTRLSTS